MTFLEAIGLLSGTCIFTFMILVGIIMMFSVIRSMVTHKSIDDGD